MASRRIVGTLCRFSAQRSGARRRFAGLCSARTDPRANTVPQPHGNRHAGDLVTSPLHKYVTAQQGHRARGYASSHYDKWTELSYEDLVALIDSGDIQLIDVREPKEIEDSGAIPRSVNIPLGDLKGALKQEDARFTEYYRIAKPQPHDTNIVFYGLGSIKSTAALEIAHKVGFKKARHYPGGFDEWITKQRLQH